MKLFTALNLCIMLPLQADTLGKDDLLSGDGSRKVCIVGVHNIREHDEIGPEGGMIFVTGSTGRPFAAHASKEGVNQGAWTGSSKYLFLATGEHKDQEVVVVFGKSGEFQSGKISLDELYEFGEKILPSGPGPASHDVIGEVRSAEGDSVTILYLRTKYPKSFVVPVNFQIKDGSSPSSITLSFGKVVWLDEWGAQLPSIESLRAQK